MLQQRLCILHIYRQQKYFPCWISFEINIVLIKTLKICLKVLEMCFFHILLKVYQKLI